METKVVFDITVLLMYFQTLRFWGDEIYESLLAIKKTWDPEMVFSCRHCVGDGEAPGIVSKTTRPSWRFKKTKQTRE